MQTEYSIDQAVARVGQLADTGTFKDVGSYKAAAGAVYIGRVVTKGASDDEIVHPDAAAEITDAKLVRGIVLHSHECESQSDGADANYEQYSVVPVLRKGRAWVKAVAAATASTASVHVRYVAPLGALTGAAVTDETAVLPNAKWITSSTGANGLAVVEVNL